MTTRQECQLWDPQYVVEAYRLDRYDNFNGGSVESENHVVEAYRLDRYDNLHLQSPRGQPREL